MDQGDIIRITVSQQVEGYIKPVLNVYHYLVATLTAPVDMQVYVEDLYAATKPVWFEGPAGMQSNAVRYTNVLFENLTFQQEFSNRPIIESGMNGSISAPIMTAQLTYSFKLSRYNKTVRNGRKSISGVVAAAVTVGRTLNPGYVGYVSNAAEGFSAIVFVEGDSTDATLQPIIVRRPLNPGVTPTQWASVASAQFRGFGTQNTRKSL